jgi:hypothetical protein
MAEKINLTPTDIFKRYQKGVEYNQSTGFYTNYEKNERFYVGDQWKGVDAPNLPKPVFNILKRVITHKMAYLLSDNVAMTITPNEFANGDQILLCKGMDSIFKNIIDKSMLVSKLKEVLRDAAVDADGIAYVWFDPDVKTGEGNGVSGSAVVEQIDAINYIPGNPAVSEVQEQPYIILAKRQFVDKVKREAQDNGASQDEVDRIVSDSESRNIDTSTDNTDQDKCTVLTHFRIDPDAGTVFASICTQNAFVKPEWDTGYKRYPVAFMNWEKVKNTYHGISEVQALIPNQLSINKLIAGAIKAAYDTANPKILYDKSKVASWSNKVGAIGLNGDVTNAAKVMEGANIPTTLLTLVDNIINYTKDLMGTSDAALGNVKPDNTSAIIAVQKAAAVPLELIKLNLHKFVEEIALSIVEMAANHYGNRQVKIDDKIQSVNFDLLKDTVYSCKIDVGGGAYWDEITQMQTAENLYKAQIYDAKDMIMAIPDQYLPQKQELLKKLEERLQPRQATMPNQKQPITPQNIQPQGLM